LVTTSDRHVAQRIDEVQGALDPGTRMPELRGKMPDVPIGVFDSGVGGLSVLRHVRELLPSEDVVYVADTAWCPYGPRPLAQIRQRAYHIAARLRERGAKLVVVACNTASTAALAALRQRFAGVPFVGMEPAVKPAAALTQTGAVGVLATATTAEGEALARLVDRFGRGVAVHVAVPEGLVELVEAGRGDSAAADALLRPILARWRAARVDAVVLGCTHYPFARATIERLAGPGVAVIDPAPAVARQAARVLAAADTPRRPRGMASQGGTTFLTTGDPDAFRDAVQRLMPPGWGDGAVFGRLDPPLPLS
jgi:glutamate racemase